MNIVAYYQALRRFFHKAVNQPAPRFPIGLLDFLKIVFYLFRNHYSERNQAISCLTQIAYFLIG